jgi:uracil-DNA glycosylase
MSGDLDDRALLYGALELIEDALAGGYRLGRQAPEFDEAGPEARSRASPFAGAPLAGERGAEPAFAAPPGIPEHDSLAAIAAEAARCRKCRLASGRSRAVGGEGADRPLVLVIGEGPGAEEDRTGRPFVGPAGQLLDKMLAAIGLSRDANTYIANIVKCRPPMNRDPAPDEQAACMAYLDRQIALLRPRAILAAGRIPAQALLQTKEGIGKLRGRLWDYRGIPLVASYHPSALLRNEELKRPAWEDLKLLKSTLPDA